MNTLSEKEKTISLREGIEKISDKGLAEKLSSGYYSLEEFSTLKEEVKNRLNIDLEYCPYLYMLSNRFFVDILKLDDSMKKTYPELNIS